MDKATPASGSVLARRIRQRPARIFVLLCLAALASSLWLGYQLQYRSHYLPIHAAATVERCRSLNLQPGPPKDFHNRKESDRFEPGTPPTLIKNGRIWTGSLNGTEVIRGDILIDKGIITRVGRINQASIAALGSDLVVVDSDGAWVTPGIVDIHSHLGDDASPELNGASDTNSLKSTILPWLRSLDGLNTHDDSYPLSISGGVTTALVLPGSANAIGGQAFPIKLRQTKERSSTSMLLEPPYQINGSFHDHTAPPRWRHMKHACGENPSRVYSVTRMDTLWEFRNAYNHATELKDKQDQFCSKALSPTWDGQGEFPEDLQWEALVDVVRGKVKVNIHCYEALDLDDLVRLSNEFKFPIAAFHHASEAYLVPDVLKRAYGKPPAIALFATNGRYKREAYRASEFAPRILAENNLTVLMKSDHPVLNSRYLLYEAQQAHYYGFAENLALAAVITNSAEVMGMGHRIGYVKEGWDADLVIWDSHPLALGATPAQVFIDGIAQIASPAVVSKPRAFQHAPKTPNFDDEAKAALKYDGLPPLEIKNKHADTVVFDNVASVYLRTQDGVQRSVVARDDSPGVVVTHQGKVVCTGKREACTAGLGETHTTVDLQGGSISPSLVSYGSPLGLEHIAQESSTNDGYAPAPLLKAVPKILGGDSALVRAVDGLEFTTRDALLAYRSGVTSAITSPTHRVFISGLGTAFSTGASHRLENGAVIKDVTGVHVSIHHVGTPSVSTQVATLRALLSGNVDGDAGEWFKKVVQGEVPLVVEAHSADVIATLVLLKKQIDLEKQTNIRLTITGASEAHLLAKELGEAGVGIIVNPARPFPSVWEARRILPGPPLTQHTAVSKLLTNNVTVGLGVPEIWEARNLRFDLAWAALEGQIPREDALALGSLNLERLLGGEVPSEEVDLVATAGGELLDISSKVVAVISPRRNGVDLL